MNSGFVLVITAIRLTGKMIVTKVILRKLSDLCVCLARIYPVNITRFSAILTLILFSDLITDRTIGDGLHSSYQFEKTASEYGYILGGSFTCSTLSYSLVLERISRYVTFAQSQGR